MSKRELERKQKEEQEATAYAFQEFIRTFQDNPGPPNKLFVKSGLLNAKPGQEERFERGTLYNPKPISKKDSHATIKNAIECARLLKDNRMGRFKGQEKPKTNLELLKEELKSRHMERDERNKYKEEITSLNMATTGAEEGDPTTTNLFVANLNPKVTEQNLMQLFGAYGPLASVKIMWPRGEERNRGSNCGFVAFMSRKDGERALSDLKDRDDMRIGWGKSVELPVNPVYIPPELLKSLLPPPFTGLPFNAQPLKQPFDQPETDEDMKEILYNSVIKVTIPLDKKILMTVHRMIEFVIREGPLFEAMIMNREINNPSFQFLFGNKNAVHIYYRWKLYSIMHGESQKNWSTKEFRMFKEGPVWIPPVIPNYAQGMPQHLINSSSKVDKSLLSEAQKSRLVQFIQNLNVNRQKIAEAMIFCLNHSDAVKDVVDIIVESFENVSTKATKKIARLYLLSDIMCNCSLKNLNALAFRTEFKNHLFAIFESLQKTQKNLNTSFDKDGHKSRVLKVLRSWDLWNIYPSEYLNKLECSFLGTAVESENLDESSEADEPLDGANLIKLSIKNNPDCQIQKELRITHTQSDTQKFLPGFIPSRWETVDPEKVEAQAMSTKKFYDLEMEGQRQKHKDQSPESKKNTDQRREKLRKVEVMVMQYQDEFESGKCRLKKGISLEKTLNDYRKHLLHKMKREDEGKKQVTSPISSNSFSSDECDKRDGRRKKRKYKKKEHGRDKDRKKYSRN